MTFNFGIFLSKIISTIFIIFREFWWLIIPLALFIYFRKIYQGYKKQIAKPAEEDPLIYLELKFSSDSFKQPVTSMKNFFENLKNIKIKDDKKVVFEIICCKNQLRYLCILPKSLKDLIEVAFYSQYPDIKINEISDFVCQLPPNIPNNNFDIWGEEYKLKKESIYQINTIKSDIISDKDSKVIDPITILLETTAKADYQGIIIFQIVLSQLNKIQKEKYSIESDNVINKILGKPPIVKKTATEEFLVLFTQVFRDVISAASAPKEEVKKEPSSEDKEKAKNLKTKNDYGVFSCNFRVAYISPKECTEKFVPSSINMFIQRFTSSQNSFEAIANKGVELKTETLLDKWLTSFSKNQIELNMKRDLFQRVINRKIEKKFFVLNSEELASIYHFPFQKVSSKSLDYIKNKESAPPPNLPIIQ